MDQDQGPRLPIELMLPILESFSPPHAVALRLDDPTAQTIKAFTLVSRTFYPIATRLLYTHCLYIDSSDRMMKLLITLNKHVSYDPPPEMSEIESNTINRSSNTLPKIDILSFIQNLYLAPFPRNTIDDLPTAHWIYELFTLTRHTLRRLVVSIPFHTLPVERDHLNVRPRLMSAFRELTSIEEFVCAERDLWSYANPQVMGPRIPAWAIWKKLRRLAFQRSDVATNSLSTWDYLRKLPHLETVVLNGPGNGRELLGIWLQFFQRLMVGREKDVSVVCPRLLFGSEPLRQKQLSNHLDRISEAQRYHAEKVSSSASRSEGVGPLRFSAVAIPRGKCESDPVDLMTNWCEVRGAEGSLWDLSLLSAVKRSEIDENLWIDELFVISTGGDENDDS